MSDSKTTVVPEVMPELWLLRMPSGTFVRSLEGKADCLNAWPSRKDCETDRQHFAGMYDGVSDSDNMYADAVPVRVTTNKRGAKS